jgi:hypothetical protein
VTGRGTRPGSRPGQARQAPPPVAVGSAPARPARAVQAPATAQASAPPAPAAAPRQAPPPPRTRSERVRVGSRDGVSRSNVHED